MTILTLLLSCPGTYAVLAAFVAMIVFSAGAKYEQAGEAGHRSWCWKWLQPVPAEVRLLMQEAASRRDFPRDLLAACVADYNVRLSNAIKQIPRAGSSRRGLPAHRSAVGT
jgi:hypothetical protein